MCYTTGRKYFENHGIHEIHEICEIPKIQFMPHDVKLFLKLYILQREIRFCKVKIVFHERQAGWAAFCGCTQ